MVEYLKEFERDKLKLEKFCEEIYVYYHSERIHLYNLIGDILKSEYRKHFLQTFPEVINQVKKGVFSLVEKYNKYLSDTKYIHIWSKAIVEEHSSLLDILYVEIYNQESFDSNTVHQLITEYKVKNIFFFKFHFFFIFFYLLNLFKKLEKRIGECRFSK